MNERDKIQARFAAQYQYANRSSTFTSVRTMVKQKNFVPAVKKFVGLSTNKRSGLLTQFENVIATKSSLLDKKRVELQDQQNGEKHMSEIIDDYNFKLMDAQAQKRKFTEDKNSVAIEIVELTDEIESYEQKVDLFKKMDKFMKNGFAFDYAAKDVGEIAAIVCCETAEDLASITTQGRAMGMWFSLIARGIEWNPASEGKDLDFNLRKLKGKSKDFYKNQIATFFGIVVHDDSTDRSSKRPRKSEPGAVSAVDNKLTQEEEEEEGTKPAAS